TREFLPSFSVDSLFAGNIRLSHVFEAGGSGIEADLPDPTGRRIRFSYGAGGTASLATQLVYDGGAPGGDIVLAESTSTVGVAASSGSLPTEDDKENADQAKASWSLSPEGVLTV